MSRISLDDNAQPPEWINTRQRVDRQIHEMLGLIKGIVCDGTVNEEETHAFRQWMIANPDVAAVWPGRDLAVRIDAIFSDKHVDLHERHELYELFCSVGGHGDETPAQNQPATLPFNDPMPALTFPGYTYVFTGSFVWGTRKACEIAVQKRGGTCRSTIIKKPLILVIGSYSSRDWKQSSFGRKIEKAVEYRDEGVPIVIVGEEHWVTALGSDPSSQTSNPTPTTETVLS